MSAIEIIHAIESLPTGERAEVFRYLVGLSTTAVTPRAAWREVNIRERQRRICADEVLPNAVLEARQLDRY